MVTMVTTWLLWLQHVYYGYYKDTTWLLHAPRFLILWLQHGHYGYYTWLLWLLQLLHSYYIVTT